MLPFGTRNPNKQATPSIDFTWEMTKFEDSCDTKWPRCDWRGWVHVFFFFSLKHPPLWLCVLEAREQVEYSRMMARAREFAFVPVLAKEGERERECGMKRQEDKKDCRKDESSVLLPRWGLLSGIFLSPADWLWRREVPPPPAAAAAAAPTVHLRQGEQLSVPNVNMHLIINM